MSRRASMLLAAALMAGGAGPAAAVCPVTTACTATPFLGNPACCGATSCTLDGSVTTSGPACTFDFDGRTVNLTGQLNAGSNSAAIFAGSLRVSGRLSAVGTGGAPGGNLLVTTTGAAPVAFSLQAGIGTTIDVSGFGRGGTLAVLADGPVFLLAGTVRADGLDASSEGGTLRFESTSGDMSVAIPVTASSGSGFVFGGSVELLAAGNLGLTDAGRLEAIGGALGGGAIGVHGGAAVTIPTGARLFASAFGTSAGAGGEIDITGGSIGIAGVLDVKGGGDALGFEGGDGGIISLEARSGGIMLTRGTSALILDGAAGGFGGEVSMFTTVPVAGTIVIDAPITARGVGSANSRPAGGGVVSADAAADVTVLKTINVNGAGSGAGAVEIASAGDLSVSTNITGIDVIQGGFLTLSGRNLTLGGNLLMRASPDVNGLGGEIDVSADLDLVVEGPLVDTSGSGTGEGGPIALVARGDVVVEQAATLNASSGGTAADSAKSGQVELIAGFPDLAGDLTLAGDVTATSRSTLAIGGDNVSLRGCQIRVESASLVDSTGNAPSRNHLIGRNTIVVNGRIRAVQQNVFQFPEGAPPTLGGTAQVTPPFIGVARMLCTAPDTPMGCMAPCAVCGDGEVDFPEQCEPGADGCVTSCDTLCRTRTCGDLNPCTLDGCDPALGCLFEPRPDGTPCDNADVCDGHETCQSSGDTVVCDLGDPLVCDDGNPCTVESCDAATGCMHTPLHDTWAGTCNDRCVERCTSGVCTAITPPDCDDGNSNTSDSCDPANGMCVNTPGASCSADAECNDGNPCTDDSCREESPRICQNVAKANGSPCPNGDVCDGSETCQNGLCAPGTALDCVDGDPCTMDVCNALGGCAFPPIANCCETVGECDDANPCTNDACVDNRCSNIINPECCGQPADCDDGEPCTVDDCVASSCTHTPAPNGTAPPGCAALCGTCAAGACETDPCPDDADPCTEPVCDPVSGCALHPIEGCCNSAAACDDASACTIDTCDLDLHLCAHEPVVPGCRTCSSNDDCDPLGACGQTVCGSEGFCVPNTPLDCNDNDTRTLDRCVLDGAGMATCEHQCLTSAVCDDGDACNGAEQCAAGACLAGPAPAGFVGARCGLDAVAAALAGAADAQPSLRTKLEGLLGRARAKLTAAETAGLGKPARKALGATGKQLKKISKVVKGGLRKRKISQAAADAIIAAAESARQVVDALKASLATP